MGCADRPDAGTHLGLAVTAVTAHAASANRASQPAATNSGLIRWTADEDDSWRASTWVAVLVTTVGSAMAVFGLLPLNLHGPLHFYGIMDPLCGATRAVRLALRGDLAGSWRYNPIGAPLALLSLLLLARAAVGWTSGRWVTVKLFLSRPSKLALIGVVVLLAVALEVNQQMHAALLMLPR